MATRLGGADIEHLTGSLEPGKQADLVVVDREVSATDERKNAIPAHEPAPGAEGQDGRSDRVNPGTHGLTALSGAVLAKAVLTVSAC
jgi:cytosine/adenosine deaminase-related metal-dependent hydrolase